MTQIAGETYHVFGGFFAALDSPTNPIVRMDARAAMTVLQLNEGALLNPTTEAIPWSVRLQSDRGITLTARVAER